MGSTFINRSKSLSNALQNAVLPTVPAGGSIGRLPLQHFCNQDPSPLNQGYLLPVATGRSNAAALTDVIKVSHPISEDQEDERT